MEKFPHTLFLLFLLLTPLLTSCLQKQEKVVEEEEEEVYIVYFGVDNGGKTVHEIEENHYSHLFSVKETKDAKASLLYSYKHSINGFAALLTPHEATVLSKRDEVVSVYKSNPEKYSLQTTRSWEFAGVEKPKIFKKSSRVEDRNDLLIKSRFGKDVIVGMIDNGVWPESQSFSDKGMGPIPPRWKGICQSGDAFNSSHCNRKIIGARYYIKGYEQTYGSLNRSQDYLSPRDKDGHGTHTASTVGGRRVHNVAALGGFARGTASGGAPLVRLAIYKACWPVPGIGKENENACFQADMLAAMDDAIGDGVDVLSISIGTAAPIPFIKDSISIGALHAVKNNIVVSCSAGNSGPNPSTLANPPPWIITVGASSIDRAFYATLELGNGNQIQGQTITPYRMENRMYPLVHAAQIINTNVPENVSNQCLPGSLSPEKAKGKIVMCFRGNGTRVGKGGEVKRVGGIGFILANSKANGEELSVDAHLLPATAIGYTNALKILQYINSTNNPMAYISPATTTLQTVRAPYMAAFSSRGPNVIHPNIIKPDITAPGLNILAAWSGGSSPTKLDIDHRVVTYNVLSGTSMSCPHVGASAALLKAIHPTWSSAAIRSALMTTADVNDNTGKAITDASGVEANPFQFGSGHFRPTKAADPGLVYDATYNDHLLFLCASGLTNVDPTFTCPQYPPSTSDLNYPSLAITNLTDTVIVKRSVTNVGSSSKNVYFVSVKPPVGITVNIYPPILSFNKIGENNSFTITVKVNNKSMEKGKYLFGLYTWTDADGIHNVTSPIAVSVA